MKNGGRLGIAALLFLSFCGVYVLMKNSVFGVIDETRLSTNVKDIKPVTDQKVTKQKFCRIYRGSQQKETDKFECIKTKLDPSYTACLHDNEKDNAISLYLRKYGSWEKDILAEVKQLIQRDPNLHFIDVGANIGVYSLAIAKMGRKVVAVEPFIENIRRLYKAAEIDGTLDKIKVIQNAVSDTREVGVIRAHPKNQGDTRIIINNVTCIGYSCKEGTDTKYKIYSILMNDLLEVIDFDRAIMKMDIQGYEHRAFMNALPLLDKIFIPVIFMEWNLFQREHFKLSNPPSQDQRMINGMIDVLLSRNFRPFKTLKSKDMLDVKNWNDWPTDIVWKYHICC